MNKERSLRPVAGRNNKHDIVERTERNLTQSKWETGDRNEREEKKNDET